MHTPAPAPGRGPWRARGTVPGAAGPLSGTTSRRWSRRPTPARRTPDARSSRVRACVADPAWSLPCRHRSTGPIPASAAFVFPPCSRITAGASLPIHRRGATTACIPPTPCAPRPGRQGHRKPAGLDAATSLLRGRKRGVWGFPMGPTTNQRYELTCLPRCVGPAGPTAPKGPSGNYTFAPRASLLPERTWPSVSS